METSVGKPLAISMLIASTRNDYNDMRNKCLECYKLQDHELPTFYYITMQHPKMVKGVIDSIKEPYKILGREYRLAQEARKKEAETKKDKMKAQYYCEIKGLLADCVVHLLEKYEHVFSNQL